MNSLVRLGNVPGLLVSVRNSAEALAALAGNADVIDVKEPDRGPLGAADPQTIRDIVQIVAGRVPVTAAAGELLDTGDHGAACTIKSLSAGVSLYKIGLHGCRDISDWKVRWKQTVALCAASANRALPVAVVYADWQPARAPEPWHVLQAAAEFGCPALLVDTWDKSGGNVFEHWSPDELRRFISFARVQPMAVVLAGSLGGSKIATAARLTPDFVAVRGAACENGRSGAVTAERVAELKQIIAKAGTQHTQVAPI
jgi:uncharacterized protein (UPF0264 family)